MDNSIVFEQPISDTEKYAITLTRERDIIGISLLETISAEQQEMVKAAGVNPTYVRVCGKVELLHEKNGKTETISQDGLWEQMFFGNDEDLNL